MNREEAKRQATELVKKLTLEEKASQLKFNSPAIKRLGIPSYNWWNEALHGVARAGTATVFPQAIGLAAMFDEDFLEKIGDAVSTEARAKYNGYHEHGDNDIYKGLTMWSPNINIFRDPRWGRGHETYGEDPFLTGRLGVSYIKGLQGNGKYLKTAACAKHFAVHSGPEALRHEFNAKVSQKDLYETYLPAFEVAVKEGHVEAVMGAYNRVNDEPACGSKILLNDILRESWGFEGHVTSDCGAIKDFHTGHMVTSTAPESAALALKNGCDVNCGQIYLHILQAYQDKLIDEKMIDRACIRLFTTRYMLGMFADDCEYDKIGFDQNDTDEHNAMALKAARKSMVLLKNDGILPLDSKKIRTVAVIGPNADRIEAMEGNYCGVSSRYVTFLEGIRTYCKEHHIKVLYSEGSHLIKDRVMRQAEPDDRLTEAVICAEHADVIIACVGLDATLEGEGGDKNNEFSGEDKSSLELPECQIHLLNTLERIGKPLVTVVAAGSALNITVGNAILMAWYSGQAGGSALTDILFGAVSPSGCLPVTFYHHVEDLPDFTDYSMKNRTYRYYEGETLYPFGFGLTYSHFNVKDVTYRLMDRRLTVQAIVENDGAFDSECVVQCYIHAHSKWAERNPKLCGFKRIMLFAGKIATVQFAIDQRALMVVNDNGQYVFDTDDYDLFIGFGQPDQRTYELTGNRTFELHVCLPKNCFDQR